MNEYRNRVTGEVKTQSELVLENPNMSFPAIWNQNVLEALNIEAVLIVPKPVPGQYETVRRSGVEQDSLGNWVQAWEVVPMFSDYTDADGVVHTRAEQEAAYQASLDTVVASSVRTERDRLLAETDWVVIKSLESGKPVSVDWATYRQALRDITDQIGFPNSVTWPTKP